MIQEKSNIQLTNWELVSVNPSNKIWNWKDLFCFWGNTIQSIIGFSIIASLYLVYELNVSVVFFGTFAASLLVVFLTNLIGKPSQKHGIPFPVFLRTSMGIFGAKYVAILRGLVAIFMFGVQTFFLSKSIGYLIRISLFSIDSTFLDKEIFTLFFYGLNIIDWFSFVFAIFLQIYLFRKGQIFNKIIINISAIFVYIGLILFCAIIASTNLVDVVDSFKDLLVFDNVISKSNISPFLTVFGTMFAYFSIVIVNFGDFSRFVKNENELKKGNLSLLINLIFFSIFAIFIVIGADIILNKNLQVMDRILVSPTDIIGKFDNIFLSVAALFFILFATASTNLIANFIPSQNCLINLMPSKLNPTSSGVIIGILGFFIGALWVPLLSQIGILSIVDTFGAFFGPIFGIIIADYYLIKEKEIVNKDIFSTNENGAYYFSGGWHLKAIYALLVAFVFSAATIWNPEFRFLQSYSWLIGAFIGFMMHYLLSKK
ncbi:MAG: cytosine permease [Pelagibacterales bacterium]|nr:cytosine permease [Pelagibacterales bacterium]